MVEASAVLWTEEEIFKALNLGYRSPTQRNCTGTLQLKKGGGGEGGEGGEGGGGSGSFGSANHDEDDVMEGLDSSDTDGNPSCSFYSHPRGADGKPPKRKSMY